MEELQEYIDIIWRSKIINSIVIIILSVLLYKFTTYLLDKSEEKSKIKLFTSNKGKTYIKLIISIIRYIFICINLNFVLFIY